MKRNQYSTKKTADEKIIDGDTFTWRVTRAVQLAVDGEIEEAEAMYAQLRDEVKEITWSTKRVMRRRVLDRLLCVIDAAAEAVELVEDDEIDTETAMLEPVVEKYETRGMIFELEAVPLEDGGWTHKVRHASSGIVLDVGTERLDWHRKAIAHARSAAEQKAVEMIVPMLDHLRRASEPTDAETSDYISHEHGFADDRPHEKPTFVDEITVTFRSATETHDIDIPVLDRIEHVLETAEERVRAVLRPMLAECKELDMHIFVSGISGDAEVK